MSGSGLHSERELILVAVPERHIARLIQINLQRQGYRIECRFDGDDLLRRLDEVGFISTIVLDEYLPGASSLLGAIRLHARHSRVRVVWLSGKQGGKGPFDSSGPDVFLTKPFDPVLIVSHRDSGA